MAFVLNDCPQTLGPSRLVFLELLTQAQAVNVAKLRERFGMASAADGRGDDLQYALDFLTILGLTKRENDQYRIPDTVRAWVAGSRQVSESQFRQLLLLALAQGERRDNPARFVLDIYGYLLQSNVVLVNTEDGSLHISIRGWIRQQRWDTDMQLNDISPDKFPNKEKMKHWATICGYLGLIHRVTATQYVVRPDPTLLLTYCANRVRSRLPNQHRLPLEAVLNSLQELFGLPSNHEWPFVLSQWVLSLVRNGNEGWLLDHIADAGPRYRVSDAGLLIRDATAGMNVLAAR